MPLGFLRSAAKRLERRFAASPVRAPKAEAHGGSAGGAGRKPEKARAKGDAKAAKSRAKQAKAARAEAKRSKREAAASETALAHDLPLVEANVPCCVCGRSESDPAFTTHYKTNKGTVPFHMRRCGGCGLLFNSPRLPDDQISEYYDGSYYVFQRADAEYFLKSAWIYQRTIQCLEVPESRREIAEIGSGKGYLLALLQDLGWKVQGVELSGEAAAYAEREIGVPTFAGPLEAFLAQRPGCSFPVIACIDVIEHVPDPAAFAAALARATAPGSLLVIDTPNGRAQAIEGQGAAWRGFNPYHIFVFDPDNLARLLEAHGFLVLQSFTYNNGAAGETGPRLKAGKGDALDPAAARAGGRAMPDAAGLFRE